MAPHPATKTVEVSGTELASRSLNTAEYDMNRNAHSLQRQNELEQQLMSRSAPNDAVLPEPRPPPQKPRTDLDALFALTKRFCCVQIGNCFILLIAVPASIYCMILSMGILIGFLGSIKFVEVRCAAKSEREKRDVFGRHWLLLMHLWLPYAAMTRAHEAWRFSAPVSDSAWFPSISQLEVASTASSRCRTASMPSS